MSVDLYTFVANCDTVKKARAWLDQHGVAYTFHDCRKQAIAPGQLAQWVDEAGWELVLNRRGTTFRALPEADKAEIDAAKAIEIMSAHPSSIKRPVVEHPGGLLVGFDAKAWEKALVAR